MADTGFRLPLTRSLCVAVLVAEAAALPLYGLAFGWALVGLIAVRSVLTIVLTVFTLRRNVVARMVLGALRLMAGLVGVVMATIAERAGLALGAVGVLDVLLGFLLLTNGVPDSTPPLRRETPPAEPRVDRKW